MPNTRRSRRPGNGKIVLATGAFDLLHLGHVRFLEESKRRGGAGARLIVIVASDKTVYRRKGRKPILPERQRRELVASLKPVDEAVLGRQNLDMVGDLRRIKPDIVCVGYDQIDVKKSVKRLIRQNALQIRVVQIPQLGPHDLNSSSKVKERIAEQLRRSPSARE